ncbi:MAG: sigma 54-interacting transcriptional regulator, partial [Bacillota bacterium]|nr:sigma 54-interacting transcriptional regulator [Bacillota bacterium]
MKNFYGTHSGEITMARPVIRKEDFSDTAFTVAPRNKEVTYDELMTATWDYLLLGHPAEKVFRRTELLRYFYSNHFRKKKIAQVPCDSPFATITVNEDYELLPEHYCNEDIAVVMDSQGGIVGVKDRFQTYQRILTDGCRQVWQKELQIDFFQKIFSAMEDDVFITDEYGFIQYINPSGEKICQIQLSDYIGKHVTELEKNSVVSQSITLEVLRTGERAEQTVKLSSGRLIMAIGLPIYNAKGEMEHVLSSSKDVKEINELLEKVANMVQDLDVQKRELENLRERMASQKNYVFESPAMKQVQKIISKVAPTDVSILIEGESGTGKEVVADFIYQCSRRHDKPFVKIN